MNDNQQNPRILSGNRSANHHWHQRLTPTIKWWLGLAIGACLLSGLLTPASAPAQTQAQSSRNIKLQVGDETTLEFAEKIISVHSSVSDIVALAPHSTKDQVTLKGLSSGRTVVAIKLRKGLTKSYEVTVTTKHMSLRHQLDLIATNLNQISGLKASITGNKVVVSGVLVTSQGALQFYRQLEKSRDLIIDNTIKKYRNARLIAQTINTLLAQNGIQNLKVRAAGKLLAIQGMAKDFNEKKLALKIAQMIDPGVEDQIEDLQFTAGASVQVDVMFLEYSDNNDLEAGLLGMTQASKVGEGRLATIEYGERTGDTTSLGQGLWTVAPLRSMLRLIQTKTKSRVMANPKMVVRSGHEATFRSGGTKYFKVSTIAQGAVTETMTPVAYGFTLNVRPKVDAIGQVDVLLNVEMSEFADHNELSLPNLTLSKTDTAVTLKNGYSVLLTGFKVQRDRKTTNRIPLIADIPIIGELFKSRHIAGEQKNIMILLTVNAVDISQNQIEAFQALSKAKRTGSAFSGLESLSQDEIEFSIFD